MHDTDSRWHQFDLENERVVFDLRKRTQNQMEFTPRRQELPIIYRHKITQILRNYRRNFQPQEAGSWLQLLQS